VIILAGLPPAFILQVTKAGCGGLGMRLENMFAFEEKESVTQQKERGRERDIADQSRTVFPCPLRCCSTTFAPPGPTW